ncbi:MAG: tetratricopeptide repeat protein [Nitrospira sp.]|jgi:tetratricopeptide (TPR) repeat protein|nr:tetratricopeptide repeat protein [Nitrospira sp.]
MNRSDRRRQDAIQGKTGHAPDSFALRNLLDQGKRHHQAGQLAEAERSYQLALNMAPGHPEALQLLGLLAYRVGSYDQAIDLITQALDASPSTPLYWFNLGVVTQRAGKKDEAVRAYERALSLNPKYVEALINLGNVFKDLQRLDEAVQAYRKALALNPSHADTHNNLGVALKEQNDLQGAIASYRDAIRLKPTHFEAWNNLGLALMETGTIDEAIASFEQALTIVPDSPKALYNLGVARIWTGEHDKALALLTRIATAKHDHGRAVTETSLFRSRLKHDAEQVRYLMERGLLDASQQRYVEALDRLTIALAAQHPTKNRCPIEAAALTPIAPSFNQFLYRASCERLAEGALNPALDVPAIESRYLGARPEVTFIDQLLRPEALTALRRFCLESTIWKKDYENGYLGAFLGDGFATPLLLQIAEELRLAFPRIFAQHRLTQAWAFKQDSARRGLTLHADAAAVNVNFWITPDEANLNPEKGGLVVYDKEAPADWNFAAYNSEQNKPKILEWLHHVGAKTIRVPYRANRAVVFNSDLFHETDEITFRDEYPSRRINITLLYGYRHRP